MVLVKNTEAPWLGVVSLAAALLIGAFAMIAFHAGHAALGGVFLVVSIALMGAAAVNVSDDDEE
jgi:hypothetical protein